MELFPLKAKKSKCLGFLVNESWKFDVSDYPGSSFGYFPPLQLPRSRQSKQHIFLHFPLLGAYIHKRVAVSGMSMPQSGAVIELLMVGLQRPWLQRQRR
jgi:hypothetical protein